MSSLHTDAAGPSPLLIESGLVLITVAVAFCWPRAGSRWFSRAEYFFGRVARRCSLAVLVVGLSALLLRMAILPISPIPQPSSPDEFSYLLAANTFAARHLTNPTHPMWMHFESFHIDQKPTYMSMYFPAQGFVMAAGKTIAGHSWYGVLATAALMCAAICWMLQGWLPPGWALFGGMLAVLRLGLFSYWVDSYWGGAVAAIGGALVLGALPRLRRAFRTRDFFWMALGMAILANSRPYEGLLVCVPAVVALGWWWVKKGRLATISHESSLCMSAGPTVMSRRATSAIDGMSESVRGADSQSATSRLIGTHGKSKTQGGTDSPAQAESLPHTSRARRSIFTFALIRRIAPAAALLIATFAFMGYYNYRVFGNVFLPPYSVNRATYASAPHFFFQSPRPEPVYRHAVMREYYSRWELDRFLEFRTPSGFIKESTMKLVMFGLFFLGFVLAIPLMFLPYACFDRRIRFLIIAGIIFAVGLWFETWFIPHYAAPFTAGLYAILLQCMRHLRAWRPNRQASGLFLVRAIPVICVLLAGLRLYAHPLHIDVDGYPNKAWYGGTRPLGAERAQVLKMLEGSGGQQLAIVRYGPRHSIFDEWVYNEPDIDKSKVVWARDMDSTTNLELIRYFKDRKVWLVEPDLDSPKILPYSLEAAAPDTGPRAQASGNSGSHEERTVLYARTRELLNDQWKTHSRRHARLQR